MQTSSCPSCGDKVMKHKWVTEKRDMRQAPFTEQKSLNHHEGAEAFLQNPVHLAVARVS